MSDLPEWRVKLRVRVQKDIEVEQTRRADHPGGAVQDAIDEYMDSAEWDATVCLEATVKPA